MPDSQLEIVGDESLTSTEQYNEFIANFLVDCSVYRISTDVHSYGLKYRSESKEKTQKLSQRISKFSCPER